MFAGLNKQDGRTDGKLSVQLLFIYQQAYSSGLSPL